MLVEYKKSAYSLASSRGLLLLCSSPGKGGEIGAVHAEQPRGPPGASGLGLEGVGTAVSREEDPRESEAAAVGCKASSAAKRLQFPAAATIGSAAAAAEPELIVPGSGTSAGGEERS